MGDQIAVLRAGKLEQVGDPTHVYERPQNVFVARFLGTPPMNVMPAGLLGSGDGTLLGVRPERMRLVGGDEGRLRGEVAALERTGADVIVHVQVGADIVLVRGDIRDAPQVGDMVAVAFNERDVHEFSSSGSRLR